MIRKANWLTGFNMKCNTQLKWVKYSRVKQIAESLIIDQKQLPEVFFKNSCSWKFRNIHRYLPVNIAKCLWTPIFKSTYLQLHSIKKPVIWFAMQIDCLVSVWNATLSRNGSSAVVGSSCIEPHYLPEVATGGVL